MEREGSNVECLVDGAILIGFAGMELERALGIDLPHDQAFYREDNARKRECGVGPKKKVAMVMQQLEGTAACSLNLGLLWKIQG